jgi:hypothetical protein
MDIDRAIRVAQTLLPGEGGITEESDPRWQALLAIAESVSEEPEAVWDFVHRWGLHHDGTLRHAVAVLLLQPLLAQHFDPYFQLVVRQVRESKPFADTFARCAKYGQSEAAGNSEAWDELMAFAQMYCRAVRGTL